MTQGALFDLDIKENNEPIDDTEISTVLVYMSNEDYAIFKKLAKKTLEHMYPDDYRNKNACDLIIHLLNKYAHENSII